MEKPDTLALLLSLKALLEDGKNEKALERINDLIAEIKK